MLNAQASRSYQPWSVQDERLLRLLASVKCSSSQIADILERPKGAVRMKAHELGVRFASLQCKGQRRLNLKDVATLVELIARTRAAKQDLTSFLVSKGYVSKLSQKNILIRVRSGWEPKA